MLTPSFPLNNHPTKSDESEPVPLGDDALVHPDDDVSAARGIPIFRPSMEEFKVSGKREGGVLMAGL